MDLQEEATMDRLAPSLIITVLTFYATSCFMLFSNVRSFLIYFLSYSII